MDIPIEIKVGEGKRQYVAKALVTREVLDNRGARETVFRAIWDALEAKNVMEILNISDN